MLDFLFYVAVLVAFTAIYFVGKFLCVRIAWNLGWRPKVFDQSQVDLTVQECSAWLLKEWSAGEAATDGGLDVTRLKECAPLIRIYTQWVIEEYVQNLLLPRLRPRKFEEAAGEPAINP